MFRSIVVFGFLSAVFFLCSSCATKTVTATEPLSAGYYASYEGTDSQFGAIGKKTAEVDRPYVTQGKAQIQKLKLYLIELGAGEKLSGAAEGKIGCGDRLVFTETVVSLSKEPIRFAIEALLALPRETGSTYNALAGSSLKVKRVEVAGKSVQVDLVGDLHLGGVCDAPRVKAQLQSTALQFTGIETATFTINGQDIGLH